MVYIKCSFNSLSRDHKTGIGNVIEEHLREFFQLPLSGSPEYYDPELRDVVLEVLSTPSLGITYDEPSCDKS